MTTILKMRDETDLRRRLELCGQAHGLVRIDRRTRCGNPWVAGRDGCRAEVVAHYRVAARRRSTTSQAPR